jgi:hypothetical protein
VRRLPRGIPCPSGATAVSSLDIVFPVTAGLAPLAVAIALRLIQTLRVGDPATADAS